MKIPAVATAALIIAAAFVIQAIGYAISEELGDYCLLLSIAIVAAACWSIGSMLSRKLVLLAAIVGAAIGLAYWFVDWQFLNFLRIDVLHQFNENNISWIAGLYALLMWPITVVCGLIASIAAWRSASGRQEAAR